MTLLGVSGWPLVMLAATATTAVVWLFFIRPRHPVVVVPSLVLWRRVLAERKPDSLIERLRRLVSLLIALLMTWLLVGALARPERTGRGRGPGRLALVLDTSSTMLTRAADGRTRWDHALDEARREIARTSPASEVLIADTGGRAILPYTTDLSLVRWTLDRLAPRPGSGVFPPVDRAGARVVLITDGVAGVTPPAGTTVVSVFEPAINLGITRFAVRAVRAESTSDEADIEVTNFSRVRRQARLELPGAERRLQLAPGEIFHETLDASEWPEGEIGARLEADGDAYPLDDEARAYVPRRRAVRLALVRGASRALETVLGLMPRVELSIVEPTSPIRREAADAWIADGVMPASIPDVPALVFTSNTGTLAALGFGAARPVAAPVLDVRDADHPLMRGVALGDVQVARAAVLEHAGADARVLVTAGPAALALAIGRPVRRVVFAFEVDDSDLATQRAFPVFIQNAIDWLAGEPSSLSRPTGEVAVSLPDARVRAVAGGAPVGTRPLLGATVFDAERPAVFVAESGTLRQLVVVNPSPAASDVNRSPLARGDARRDRPGARSGLWVYLLLGSLVIAGAEWWTYHRRLTV